MIQNGLEYLIMYYTDYTDYIDIDEAINKSADTSNVMEKSLMFE